MLAWLVSGHVSVAVVAVLVALCIGSFLNVVIYRLPKILEREWREECASLPPATEPIDPRFGLAFPPSRCPQCQAPIRAWQNIPILSWLFLRGRCAGCQAAIPWRYPAVELLAGVLVALVLWTHGQTLTAVAVSGLFLTLLALTGIDLDHRLLPDRLTLPLLWAGLLVNQLGWGLSDPASALWGAVAGYLVLWLVFWGFKLLTGKEGMGYGDFKLLAALGAWLGWQSLPLVILLSSLVGAVMGLLLQSANPRYRDEGIPFGPYLAIAGMIAALWGPELLQWYWQQWA